MNKSPAFQFYPNDWLSSTVISLMTSEQEGAYIRLLCYAWNDPDCSIPDDDATLSVLSRLGERWFNGGSTVILKCFEPHPILPHRLVNMRLIKEKEKQEIWKEISRKGGKTSGKKRRNSAFGKSLAKKRWGKNKCEPNANQTVRNHYEPNANTSSSSSSSFSSSSLIFKSLKNKYGWLGEIEIEWDKFVEMRSKSKSPIRTDYTVTLAVDELFKLKERGHSLVDVLNQSVLNGWTGLYPIKNNLKSKEELRQERIDKSLGIVKEVK